MGDELIHEKILRLGLSKTTMAGVADEIDRLRAENQELLEALEAVEWILLNGHIRCPDCYHREDQQHSEDCKLGNALKQARGEK